MSGCGAERGLISVDEAIELISNRPKKIRLNSASSSK